MREIQVSGLEYPIRLDKWLQSQYDIPFHLVQKFIRKKLIKLNGKSASASDKVQNTDVIVLRINTDNFEYHTNDTKKDKLYYATAKMVEDNIIFKDENIIIINKPYDLPVQGGSKIKISVDDVLEELKFGYENKPKLVHRLDRHTTGILVLARTATAALHINKMFKDKLITKKYWALVDGTPQPYKGTINSDIEGKEAITKYEVLSKKDGASLVEFIPVTGRTHQLRIHAVDVLKAPIVGDGKYGYQGNVKKLCLHAYQIEIPELLGKKYKVKAEGSEVMSFLKR